MPNKIKAGLTSCKPIFTASAIRNNKLKIPNQKHTNRAHITLIQICIHTWPHTHIATRIAIPKPTAKRTHAIERFEPATVAIGSRRLRWQRGVESDQFEFGGESELRVFSI